LVTIIPRGKESTMFHQPNIEFVEMQAQAIGIPLVMRELKADENEEDVLKEVLGSMDGIEGVVTGTLFSVDQKMKLDGVCKDIGKEHLSISWERDMGQYWQEMLVSGFDVIVTSVNAQGMGEEWLGRKIDEEALKDLAKLRNKHEIHEAGEFGEFSTFVRDGPIFSKKVVIKDAHRHWTGVNGVFMIKDAELAEK
ncbi:MAG: diphthine--ammonia ligase, partial [Candidatus Aenigmarchaeota archaeon]|nr:diphthine--ammonia ligase [Candidatus Aenigmarchaeota archaeon]